jgi:hypothetical protein
MKKITSLASSRNISGQTHAGGEVVIATVWFVFYLIIVAITVTNGAFSSAIEIAGLH